MQKMIPFLHSQRVVTLIVLVTAAMTIKSNRTEQFSVNLRLVFVGLGSVHSVHKEQLWR